MASVTLKKISKTYHSVNVLRDIDLDIHEGEFVVFVGPSGCGKSTLLRMIAGLEEISDGDLLIGHERVNHLSPKERGVGMVFQSYALYPHMTVAENIAFGLKLAKQDKGTIEDKVKKTADILQLGPLLQRKPKEMSGGQRQRVAIGRAMAREPKIMLFDEPLSNLDASLRIQMRSEIAKLHDRLKSTMIYVTHDQVEAMTLADKIVVLNAGGIEQVGSPYDLYENPATLFVAGFIGSPNMNVIKCHLHQPGESVTALDIPELGALSVNINSQTAQMGEKVSLGVRPEHMEIHASEQGLEIINVEYLGNESFVYLQIGKEEIPLVARVPAYTTYKVGDRVRVSIAPTVAHLFDDKGRAFKRT